MDDLRDLEQSKDLLGQLLGSMTTLDEALANLRSKSKKEGGEIDQLVDSVSQMVISTRAINTMIGRVEANRLKAVESGDSLQHRNNQLELELQNGHDIAERMAQQNKDLRKQS